MGNRNIHTTRISNCIPRKVRLKPKKTPLYRTEMRATTVAGKRGKTAMMMTMTTTRLATTKSATVTNTKTRRKMNPKGEAMWGRAALAKTATSRMKTCTTRKFQFRACSRCQSGSCVNGQCSSLLEFIIKHESIQLDSTVDLDKMSMPLSS